MTESEKQRIKTLYQGAQIREADGTPDDGLFRQSIGEILVLCGYPKLLLEILKDNKNG